MRSQGQHRICTLAGIDPCFGLFSDFFFMGKFTEIAVKGAKGAKNGQRFTPRVPVRWFSVKSTLLMSLITDVTPTSNLEASTRPLAASQAPTSEETAPTPALPREVQPRRNITANGGYLQAVQKKLQSKEWARGVLIPLPDARGHKQDAFMLHLDSVSMLLATIDANTDADTENRETDQPRRKNEVLLHRREIQPRRKFTNLQRRNLDTLGFVGRRLKKKIAIITATKGRSFSPCTGSVLTRTENSPKCTVWAELVRRQWNMKTEHIYNINGIPSTGKRNYEDQL
jgi:hypothetical protein